MEKEKLEQEKFEQEKLEREKAEPVKAEYEKTPQKKKKEPAKKATKLSRKNRKKSPTKRKDNQEEFPDLLESQKLSSSDKSKSKIELAAPELSNIPELVIPEVSSQDVPEIAIPEVPDQETPEIVIQESTAAVKIDVSGGEFEVALPSAQSQAKPSPKKAEEQSLKFELPQFPVPLSELEKDEPELVRRRRRRKNPDFSHLFQSFGGKERTRRSTGIE